MAPKTEVAGVKPTVRIQRKSTPAPAPGQELAQPAAQLEPAAAQQTPTSEVVVVKKESEEGSKKGRP
eukprot:543778-Amphidinium_carterae.1